MREETGAKRRWGWGLWVLVALIVGVLISPVIPAYWIEVEIDRVTGSTSTRTAKLFGLVGEFSEDVSPLELWLREHGEAWTPDWQRLSTSEYNLFGGGISLGSSLSPPIYQLLVVLEEFIAASTAEEIREFVRVMETGDREAQEAAVDAAGEKSIQYLESR